MPTTAQKVEAGKWKYTLITFLYYMRSSILFEDRL